MAGETAIDRFWAKVDVRGPNECWPWTAFVDKHENGYGQFWDGQRLVKAHRFAFEIAHGAIPEGKVIDHTCHNESTCLEVICSHRACVNPFHLEATTQSINSIRGRSGDHQSSKTHCKNGHPYSSDNTILRDSGRQRVCRICNNASQIKYNAKRKAKAA